MADITDPQVVFFSNVYLRPLMEVARDLQLRLTDAATEYTTNIAGIISGNVNADPLIDGRELEGVTQLTKLDLTNTLTHLNALLTTLDTAGADALRAKLTVRPPNLS